MSDMRHGARIDGLTVRTQAVRAINGASDPELATPVRHDSAGEKDTSSRLPVDLGRTLRRTVGPTLWSYDSPPRRPVISPVSGGVANMTQDLAKQEGQPF